MECNLRDNFLNHTHDLSSHFLSHYKDCMGNHRFVGAAILAVAFCVNVVCLLTPGWLYNAGDNLKEGCGVHRGIFIEVSGNNTTPGKLNTVTPSSTVSPPCSRSKSTTLFLR